VGVGGGDGAATAAITVLGRAIGDDRDVATALGVGGDVGTALGGGGNVEVGSTSGFVVGTAVTPNAGTAASASGARVGLRGGGRATASSVGLLDATVVSAGDGVPLVGGSGPLAAALSVRPSSGAGADAARLTVGLLAAGATATAGATAAADRGSPGGDAAAAADRGSLCERVAGAGAGGRGVGGATWLFASGFHRLFVRPRRSDGRSSGEVSAWLSRVPPRRRSSTPARPASLRTP
jgi:hypothetical protein